MPVRKCLVVISFFGAALSAFFCTPDPVSAETVIPLYATISDHETWSAANGPYLVSILSVPAGASLTIEPGTVIKGLSTLSVEGTLTVGAIGAEKVVFTSFTDDADDENGVPNENGDWGGIAVSGSGIAIITDTVFKYGGLSNRYVVQSSGTATVSVVRSEFVYGNNALLIDGGVADVYDNTFRDLGQYAIRQTDGTLRFGRNAFTNIASRTVSLEGGTTQSDGGNTGGGIAYFTGQTISGSATIPDDGFTYVVGGVTVASGGSLTIEPGALVKVSGTWPIISRGTLIIGSSEQDAKQVLITSTGDDSVGADVGNDPVLSETGNWGGINLESGTATIANTAFRYGGYNTSSALFNSGAQVSVSHTEFAFGNNAISLLGGTMDVYDTVFRSFDQFDIWQTGGMLHFGRNVFDAKRSESVYMTGGSFQNDGGNTGTGGISIRNIVLSEDMIFSKDNLPYVVSSIDVPAERILTIQPGAIVKMMGSIRSSGILTVGSLDPDAEKVVITSYTDDSVGGDSNKDGAATVPSKYDWSDITINGGTATFRNATVSYGGSVYGAQLAVSGGSVLVEQTHFEKGSLAVALVSGSLSITDSELSDGTTGLKYYGGTLSMTGNSIHGNSEYGVVNSSSTQTVIDAWNNWWGSPTGPKQYLTNPNGLGDLVSDAVLYDPWLAYDPVARFQLCGDHCYSSVLFLPGLEASRLYEGNEQLWEPHGDADAERLRLDENGNENVNIYTKDVIDNAYVPVKGNIYQSFLADLDEWSLGVPFIQDYSVVPYDWRLSFDTILSHGKKEGERIYYAKSDSGQYITDELKRLAAGSYTGKVTIIAHSNGGLLAKKLINSLSTEEKKLVDNLVLVAVPQSGTPQAIGALLHGYDQGLPVNWMPFNLSYHAARVLAHDMPSAYPLLPSSEYFFDRDISRRSVISFEDSSLTEGFIGKYGHEIKDVNNLYDFLRDTDGKVDPFDENVYAPTTINTNRLAEARVVHDELDDAWQLPDGIKLYQIAGYGEDTLESIRYKTGKICTAHIGVYCTWLGDSIKYSLEVSADGDGTVKASSALARSGEKYWVKLNDYNKRNISREHADIFEVQDIRDFIKNNILAGLSTTLPIYISDSEPPIDISKRFKFSIFSPVALSVKDADGHVVSATTSDIPGARYKRFGEVQYISVPASVHPTVMLDGEAEGSFTLEVKEVEGDTVMAETTFVAIPNTADTRVTMDFPDGTLEQAEPLVIDYDGNGEPDLSLEPKIGEVVTTEQQDTTAPVTTFSLSGTEGENGWYTSNVAITLSAVDEANGSGVDKIEYSIDGDVPMVYVEPFVVSKEGSTTIQYFSTDKEGNKEVLKAQIIKIDKTAPEAKITFSLTTQQLEIAV